MLPVLFSGLGSPCPLPSAPSSVTWSSCTVAQGSKRYGLTTTFDAMFWIRVCLHETLLRWRHQNGRAHGSRSAATARKLFCCNFAYRPVWNENQYFYLSLGLMDHYSTKLCPDLSWTLRWHLHPMLISLSWVFPHAKPEVSLWMHPTPSICWRIGVQSPQRVPQISGLACLSRTISVSPPHCPSPGSVHGTSFVVWPWFHS